MGRAWDRARPDQYMAFFTIAEYFAGCQHLLREKHRRGWFDLGILMGRAGGIRGRC